MANEYVVQSSSEQSLIANQENQKKWSQLVKRAWVDETLKQRLLNNPTTLFQENGIEIPAGVEVRVVEDKDAITCLIQPQKPAGDVTELTGSDLSSIIGGSGKAQTVEYLKITLREVFIT
jgi:hypothetical protein